MVMDTRERMAIASLHGVDPAKVRSGGEPELTPQDIAGAMGMGHLTSLQGNLLLAKYCGFNDQKTRSAIYASTLLEIERRWPGWYGQKQVPLIVRAAIFDVLPPDRVPGQQIEHGKCVQCGGTGIDWLAVPAGGCEPCGATGRATNWNFSGLWSDRHVQLVRHLQMLEQSGIDDMEGY